MTRLTEPARIAVLDIGKTNLKLLVASEDGWPLETHSIPNAATSSGPYLAYDLARLEEWFLDALAEVSQRHAIGAVIAQAHRHHVVRAHAGHAERAEQPARFSRIAASVTAPA